MIRMTTTALDVNQAPVAASEGVSLDFAQNLIELIDPDTLDGLAAAAREQAADGGLKLLGSDGLLVPITKAVLEAALAAELDEHLAAESGANRSNGTRRKTLRTEIGPVSVDVPRDRAGSFAPAVVGKRSRRTSGIDEMVISLVAKGLTTGEVAAHLHEVFGVEASKDTVSAITDRVLDTMAEWRTRPLDEVYPVVFCDAIHVKVRDGKVANKAVYVALGVDVDGCRDILGLWVGEGGEGAGEWHQYLTEVKNRGVRDICILICDGINGLPGKVNTLWPATVVQTCVIHLLRNTYRYASKRDWAALAKDLKPVYTAPSAEAALDRFAEFADRWEKRYPAVIGLWERAWSEFVPFLSFDPEIRTVICTTNAIESLNVRLRRVANASGHFPSDQAALKRLYLAIRSLDPTGRGRKRWTNRWKAPLNAFEVTFNGRLTTRPSTTTSART
jgi:transposase-like protein